jgi:hypothetical protein
LPSPKVIKSCKLQSNDGVPAVETMTRPPRQLGDACHFCLTDLTFWPNSRQRSVSYRQVRLARSSYGFAVDLVRAAGILMHVVGAGVALGR